eukprot:11775031-Alexandrium_andersonii.AAC.1
MSASLVGSEMCIRDRSLPPCHRLPPRKSRPRACASARQSFAISSCAVSYTHLTLPTICSV